MMLGIVTDIESLSANSEAQTGGLECVSVPLYAGILFYLYKGIGAVVNRHPISR